MAFESAISRIRSVNACCAIDRADEREYSGLGRPEPRWARAKRRVPGVDTCLNERTEKPALSVREAFQVAGYLRTCVDSPMVDPQGFMAQKKRDAERHAAKLEKVLFPGHGQGEPGTCKVVVEPRRWTR